MRRMSDTSRRRYETPLLTDFGDAAALTRQSSGSVPVSTPVASPPLINGPSAGPPVIPPPPPIGPPPGFFCTTPGICD